MTKITHYFLLLGVLVLCSHSHSQTFSMSNGISSHTTCGGTFYDSGGTGGDYSSNENGTVTFYPSIIGASVELTFNTFQLEGCCDFLYVYNGNSISSPALVNGVNGTDTPNGGATITSTASDGSLTVRFTSDGSVVNFGWSATLSCANSTLPACSGLIDGGTASVSSASGAYSSVFNVNVSGSSIESGIDYQWQSAPSATGPWTDIAGATSFVSSITAASFATITYYRLQSTCTASSEISYSTIVQYETIPIFTMTNGTTSITTCGGTFLDSGGSSGNYSNGESGIITFYPSVAGAAVQLTFNSFELEGCCDYLYVYDGNSITAPVLVNGVFGTNTPNGGLAITSTAADGSLTVRFTSDGSVNYPGWSATLGCIGGGPCTVPIDGGTASINPTFGGFSSTFNTTVVGTTVASGIDYQWQSAPSATGPWTNVTGATTISTTITAPAFATITYYRMRSICAEYSDTVYTNTTPYETQPVFTMTNGNSTFIACEGVFYDSGGATGNYSINENGTVTFYPSVLGASVELTFTEFELEGCCDYLYVYDGNSVSAPVLVNGVNGTDTPNGGNTITSTATDGSLTVRFTSDGSVVRFGWVATLSCTGSSLPACAGTIDGGVASSTPVEGPFSTVFNANVTGSTQASGIDYQWQSAPSATGPWTDIVGATTYTASITSPSYATITYYRVRSICETSSDTVFSTVTQYETIPVFVMSNGNSSYTTCGGTFYDSGGLNANYSNGENGVVTFYPSGSNAFVQLTFTSFEFEGCCDYLYVYDGNSITSPVLVDGVNGTDTPNGGVTITSTAADGSLTVRFTSDGSVTYPGWVANLSCACTDVLNPIYETVCSNELPYAFGGQSLTAPGIYYDTIPHSTGCDSIVELNLTVLQEQTNTIFESACGSYTWTNGNGQTYTSSTTVPYIFENGASNGCDSVVTLVLTVNSVNTSVTSNGVTLTSVQSGGSYQWIDCSTNAPIPGATFQMYNTPNGNNQYAVIVTVNGCSDTSACISASTVGIEDIDQVNWGVYPNPGTGTYTITSSKLMNNELVKVYTTLGQLIYSDVHSGDQIILKLEDHPNGVYILQINNESPMRVIKQ